MHYRMLPLTKTEADMEKNVRASLDKVDMDKIQRYYLYFLLNSDCSWGVTDLQTNQHGLWMLTGVA
jgi:hypothetical protein